MGTISTGNYTVGGCSLYFNTTVGNASLAASPLEYRNSANNLGNIVTSEISPEVTYLDHFITASTGKRVKDKVVAVSQSLTINFTFDEMNVDNMAKFFFASTTGSVLSVFQNSLDEGSAMLYFITDVGRDMLYKIPKCTVRPDGAMALNTEDWWSTPMLIDVLQYQSSDGSSATWLAAPFGTVDMSFL